MKHYLKKIWIILLVGLSARGASITYEFSGGRFGDCVIAYGHAKWLAFKYNIPLLFKPFKYSDQLAVHYEETHLESYSREKTKIKQALTKGNLTIDPRAQCLYVVPYFSEIPTERALPWNRNWIYYEIDWDDPAFKNELMRLIRPTNAKLCDIALPQNYITVAVHVRKGEGFDGPLLSEDSKKQDKIEYADLNVPLKFPPDYFYVDQLKVLSKMFNHTKIYAYIFADVRDLAGLANRLKQQLSDYPNIEIDYRKSNQGYEDTVLTEFFAMTRFDCLIRPQSSFSIAAAKIAHYKVEIFPTAHHWEGNKSIIDKVEVKVSAISR